MACACIIIYRAGLLDESVKEILRIYQEYVIEDTSWFSIEPEWHMRPTFTDYEKQQLTEVFGCFPVQDICIFGECDRIFVAALHKLQQSSLTKQKSPNPYYKWPI